MENKIKIRMMQEEDLQKLSEIFVKVYTDFDVGEEWDIESSKKLLSYWLDRQKDLAFTAEYDNKIVGAFVAGIKPWWDGNHLDNGEIFVDPDYQKKGIGTELLRVMCENALEKYDVSFFETNTFRNSEFPLSWYKSLGFEVHDDWVIIMGDVKKILSKLNKSP